MSAVVGLPDPVLCHSQVTCIKTNDETNSVVFVHYFFARPLHDTGDLVEAGFVADGILKLFDLQQTTDITVDDQDRYHAQIRRPSMEPRSD